MQKVNKYALPTISFPYKITNRLNLMALPRKQVEDKGDGMPKLSPTGVRMSALRAQLTERSNECAWPYVKRLILLKVMYKDMFTKDRLERLDRMIAASNGTMYSKLSNSVVIIKKTGGAGEDLSRKTGKKKGWSESDWRKHMDYISQIANPRRMIQPPPIERGPRKPLRDFTRIDFLCFIPPSKLYKRLSQEDFYKNPMKVSPLAMKYVISERVKKLAQPKALKPPE